MTRGDANAYDDSSLYKEMYTHKVPQCREVLLLKHEDVLARAPQAACCCVIVPKSRLTAGTQALATRNGGLVIAKNA